MASVKIDLGFGEQAILSERTGSVISTAKHQRDAEEFLRRWPRTRSIEQESGYLRQLGLHLGHTLPGVNSSDTSERLRAAVKSGKVTVAIERAAVSAGGGVSASGPTMRPYPLEMREKAAWVAPTSAPRSYDWLPKYDDVSADDLIAYLQSVIGGSPSDAADTADTAGDDTGLSTSLSDAQPFSYAAPTTATGEVEQDAGVFLTPAEEAECEMQYEADMAECSAYAAMDKSSWGMCKERAMMRYSTCLRGLG